MSVDHNALWAKEREQATDPATALTLVGMSRLLYSVDPAELTDMSQRDAVAQLAVPGKGPLPTLLDLAQDTDFNGTVLLSFFPTAFLPPNTHGQQPYVDYFQKKWNTNQKFNWHVAHWIEQRSIARQTNYSLVNTLRSLLKTGELPTGDLFLSNDGLRTYYADFQRTDVAEQKRRRVTSQTRANKLAAKLDPQVWRDMTDQVTQAVRAIEARGGCVIVLRMPVGPAIEQVEFGAFPREQYWDPMIQKLGVPAIHYQDAPALQAFEFPDAVHADRRDKAAFTRALEAQMRKAIADHDGAPARCQQW